MVVLLAVVEGVLRPELPWRAFSVALAVGLAPTLAWRRTRPLPMVAVAFVPTSLATVFTSGDVPAMYVTAYLLVLVYALFRWGSGREIVIGSAILLVNTGLSAALASTSVGDAVGGVAILFAVATLGLAFRYRAGSRLRELDRIKLLERERLARDLHDTVAHHVSAMAIRAQAGIATAAVEPNAAIDALRVIEAEASLALAEMRAMVRVLRRDEPAENAERAPSPRLGDLARLASQVDPGPPVDVELTGDLDALPASIGTAIYHLAQESVTNARRHARHATRIRVEVAADSTSVRLRVSDDGEANPGRPAASSGYGLIGMAERAGLLGGVCEAGPNPDRGWTVTAVLPRVPE
jgi:signal transduction histidine kinase